jgi:colanic acid biosynthesis glycosyl transferase WcaI
MRFLILTQYYPPEIGGPPTRLQSVAAELMRAGHAVEVVTALPNYPRGKFFPGYEQCFYRREVRSEIVVHRVWVYPALGGGFGRMLNYASFTVTSLFGLLRAQKPDYIFVESPPLFVSVPAYMAARIWRVPFIFNVSDLWPDAIVDGGFLRAGILARWIAAMERWSYREAAYVSTVTDGIRKRLIREKGVPSEKILFLPNGVDTILYQPQPSDTSLKKQLGLDGKKIILWAGTLGYAHGLDYVLRAARLLEGYSEIHFLFVGDGSARAGLERQRRVMRLGNVTFCDPVPLEQMPRYYSIAEIGFASLLDIPVHDGARPSKVFPVLASGKPLIFVGKGEGAHLLQQANAGIVVPPEDPGALANAVIRLVEDKDLSRELGRNGRRFAEKHLQWSQLIGSWVAELHPPTSVTREHNQI